MPGNTHQLLDARATFFYCPCRSRIRLLSLTNNAPSVTASGLVSPRLASRAQARDHGATYEVIERIWLVIWIAFTGVALVLYAQGRGNFDVLRSSLGLLVAIIIIPRITRPLGRRAVDIGRTIINPIANMISYEWSVAAIAAVMTRSYEIEMLEIDHWLFGGNPSEWVQALHHPWLTEYLQIAYVSYFPVLLGVAILLVVRGKSQVLLRYCLAMTLAILCTHLLYILVPVRSPFLVVDQLPYSSWIQYSFPLEGVYFADSLRENLMGATQGRYDCFPSGHTMHTILAIYFSWYLSRPIAWIVTLLGCSIIFSTLYLRYHYGIDLLVGAPLAVLWIYVANRLARGSSTDPERATS